MKARLKKTSIAAIPFFVIFLTRAILPFLLLNSGNGLIVKLANKVLELLNVYHALILLLFILTMVVSFLYLFIPQELPALENKLLRYRWAVAAVIFALCVIFRIHGSSMAYYNQYFTTQTDEQEAEQYEIWGSYRAIRSDEWAVHTMTCFSQYYNDYQLYSQQMSLSDTNMVLDYYAPVRDLTVIGKPLSWGYLLFGNERGLSWYWCGMMILMFMTSFELFLILTQEQVLISFVGMMMIGFSPVIQWWFIPHIPIVFLYAMALFVIGYYFFTARSTWLKWSTVVLAVIAGIGFVLSLFPSCQIIAGLVSAALLAACLYRDRDRITFSGRECYRIGIVVLIVCVILGRFFLLSREDVSLLMNTVYPGKRFSYGGGNGLSALFTDLRSLFLPYRETNISNNSEIASWIQFAPAFLILFPQIFSMKKKKNDRDRLVGLTLFLFLLIEIVYMCIGFPEMLAKVTLFRYLNRIKLGYGWTAVLFTVWSVNALWKEKNVVKTWEKVLIVFAYGLICIRMIDPSLLDWLPAPIIGAEILLYVFALLLILMGVEKVASCFMIGIMCVAGLTVNPLNRGISPIINHPISGVISSVSEEDPEGRWIVTEENSILGNFLIANGAKTVNATNFYPDIERWRILDPEGRYEDAWNRYSNQMLYLTDEPTYVELIQDDLICIYLNPTDLRKLGVRYILSRNDQENYLQKYGIGWEIIFQQDDFKIYRLNYPEKMLLSDP